MVEDLVITRTETIRLLQSDKLLEKLSENYNPPAAKERIRLEMPEADGLWWASPLQAFLGTDGRRQEAPGDRRTTQPTTSRSWVLQVGIALWAGIGVWGLSQPIK